MLTILEKYRRIVAAVALVTVPGNMVKMSNERGATWGVTLSFVQGLGMIVVRELVGVYEFVTSRFPAPTGHHPIIKPEFPWGYFN